MADPAVDLAITLPPGWWVLPLDPDSRDRDIAGLVDARFAGETVDADRQNRVVALLTSAADEARRAGAVLAAQLGVTDGGEALAASLVVALRAVPGVSGPEQLRSAVRALTVAGEVAVVVDDVELFGPLGPGVRRRAIRSAAELPVATVQYWFRPPGLDRSVVVNATSPNLAAIDSLVALFDHVVSTLRVAAAEPVPAP